jgi:hypothetical protein
MPSFAWNQVSPPWKLDGVGGTERAVGGELDAATLDEGAGRHDDVALIAGIGAGTGRAKLSTGAAAWMPSQKAHSASALPSSTAWMMSWRAALPSGMTRKPSDS